MVCPSICRVTRDDVQIGLVAALGLAHVDGLDQRVDIGHADVAGRVRRRVARLELGIELALVALDLAEADDLGVELLVDHAAGRS